MRHRPFAPSRRRVIAVPSRPFRSDWWTRLALALTPRTYLDQRDLDEARDLLGRLP